jgi:Lrp/AsnC family transcriptional regulator, regulator for asnA, asnC and gidA
LKLDEIDFKILEFLRKDARMPFTEIGNALQIADSTVHVRVNKMIDEGVISGFTIKVDYEAMGRVSSLLMLDVIPGHFEEVLPNLVQSEYVDEILELHGAYVAALKISAKNLAETREEIVRIRRIPNVTRTAMITILKTWKKT